MPCVYHLTLSRRWRDLESKQPLRLEAACVGTDGRRSQHWQAICVFVECRWRAERWSTGVQVLIFDIDTKGTFASSRGLWLKFNRANIVSFPCNYLLGTTSRSAGVGL
jgi:hypothetical protein